MTTSVKEQGGELQVRIMPWTPALAVVLVLVAGAIGLEPIWLWLHNTWSSIYGNYSHGYLTAALSIWMGYRYWRSDPPGPLAPDWRGAVPLALLVGLLVAMGLVFIDGSRPLLLPPLFLSSVWLLCGTAAARRLLWPALFLYFAIFPFSRFFTEPLQLLAIAAVGGAVSISGFTAYITGEFVHLPAGVFEIARGCSGTNFLVASLALASFFALMYLRHPGHRLLLVGFAGVMAIISNWVRIYILIVIGHLTDMQHSLVADHNTFGWAVFLVFFVPVLLLARRLDTREFEAADVSATEADHAMEQENDASPSVSPSPMAPRLAGSVYSWLGSAVLASLLLLVPALVGWYGPAPSIPKGPLPPLDSAAGVRAVDRFPSAWSPITLQAVEQRFVGTGEGGATLEVYHARYPVQDWGAELFTSGNSVTGEGWQRLGVRSREVAGAGQKLQVKEHEGVLAGQRRLIWSWYHVAGTPVVNRQHARLVQLKGILAGRRDAGVVAVSVKCELDCNQAQVTLRSYLEGAGGWLLVDFASLIDNNPGNI